MGGQNCKIITFSAPVLTYEQMSLLIQQSGLSNREIEQLFKKFNENNPDYLLDVYEFKRFYRSLRTEPYRNLDEIIQYIFAAFNKNIDEKLTFDEFVIAYAITSRGEGDWKKKLEYCFLVYDTDKNGYLSISEIQRIVPAICVLLGTEKTSANVDYLTKSILDLDINRDGRVSKDEFINGLMRNFSLRSLINPFN